MRLIQPLKFKTLKMGCFKMPHLQMAVFQMGITVAPGHSIFNHFGLSFYAVGKHSHQFLLLSCKKPQIHSVPMVLVSIQNKSCPEATVIPVWKMAVCKQGDWKRGILKHPIFNVLNFIGWIKPIFDTVD